MNNFQRTTAAGIALAAAFLAAGPAAAQETFLTDALIVPMDTTYQDSGMFLAYGLVYDLLKAGVPVNWAIAPGKAYGGADFTATATDVASGSPIVAYGYRGGPFVVDSAYLEAALPRVLAWQAAHPAVAVHRATQPFTAYVARTLTFAPNAAVLVGGGETDAFAYLNAAAIPMSNGAPWPASQDKSGAYACPGTYCCPDCFGFAALAGASSTDHADGAAFDGKGIPRYCHVAVMDTPSPIANSEVVAELRAFLAYPVSVFAASQGVLAVENDASGRFLTRGGLQGQGPSPWLTYAFADDPTAQADGTYQNSGSGVGAYTLNPGSSLYDASSVRLAKTGAASGSDMVLVAGAFQGDPTKGHVAYLGGQGYGTTLPISAKPKSQGARYFLDAVFSAPCADRAEAPAVSVYLSGVVATSSNTYTATVCVDNGGPGIAFGVNASVSVPAGATVVSAPAGATIAASTVSWTLGSLAAGADACFPVTFTFAAPGNYTFSAGSNYAVGNSQTSAGASASLPVRFGTVNLLRFAVSQTSPMTPSRAQIFVTPTADPSLDPVRDLEVTAFGSGAPFPDESADLAAGSSPLVFYQLQGNSGSTMRVTKSGGRVVITY